MEKPGLLKKLYWFQNQNDISSTTFYLQIAADSHLLNPKINNIWVHSPVGTHGYWAQPNHELLFLPASTTPSLHPLFKQKSPNKISATEGRSCVSNFILGSRFSKCWSLRNNCFWIGLVTTLGFHRNTQIHKYLGSL